MKDNVYKILFHLFSYFPKKKKALILDSVKLDDNALEMANYLAQNYDFEVGIMLPKNQLKSLENKKMFIHSSIKFYELLDLKSFSWKSFKALLSPKYIFFSHSFYYGKFIKKQKLINIWHGVGHKKIHKARNESNGVPADYTIATSEMTQKMFAELFNVPKQSVLSAGLPRNDMMLRTQALSSVLKENLPEEIKGYSKLIIWMPTYRRKDNVNTSAVNDVEDVFGIKDFDIEKFNYILKQNNALCLVKTHYFVTTKNTIEQSNIQLINDDWLLKRNLLLYQFLACTDALITDYSSVMIDYSLLNNPIFCIAEDLEEYKKTQGLYFDDYENWVPTKLFENSEDFFTAFEEFLSEGKDDYIEQRQKIKDVYFEFQDENSAKRIADLTIK